MNLEWLRRIALVTLGVLLLVLVRTSDITLVPAIALLAFAAYDIVTGLRGSRHTPEVQAFELVERQAEQLRRTDPVAADRLLDQYFQECGRRAAEERTRLRAEAAVDVSAAKRLQKLLRQEMDGHRIMRERFLPRVKPEDKAAAEATISERERSTQTELGQLDDMIRRLKA